MVHVTDVRVEQNGSDQILSGRVDGHEALLTFPPHVNVSARGEPFLGVALLRAMVEHEPLVLDDSAPLDPKLVRSLPVIQAILCLWSPELSRVQIICREEPVKLLNPGAMSSFSGGVDGSCTIAEHIDDIDYLLTLDCYDTGNASDAETESFRLKTQRVADQLGKRLIFVKTNLRQLSEEFGISWGYSHGVIPSLIAAGLGVSRFFMPSSFTYLELKPWGSHPVLDPLWGTEVTEIIHDGAHHRRTEKIELVSNSPILLGQLQVCYKSRVVNCGKCTKCVRTMLALNALKVMNAPFPSATLEELSSLLTVDYDLNSAFAYDLIDFLDRHNEPAIAGKLRLKLRHYRRLQAFRRFLRTLFSTELIVAYRRLRRGSATVEKLPLSDPDDVLV